MPSAPDLDTLAFLVKFAGKVNRNTVALVSELDEEKLDEQDMVALSEFMRSAYMLHVHFSRRVADYYMETHGEVPQPILDILDNLEEL